MVLGYVRVTTKDYRSDNSLEGQINIITKEYPSAIIYEELNNKIIINKLMDIIDETTILVISSLDRISNNINISCCFIRLAILKGARIHICNIGIIDKENCPFFESVILSAKTMITNQKMEQVREKKGVAKFTEGFADGRKKTYTAEQLNHYLNMLTVNGGTYSYSQLVSKTGVSKSTLVRAMKERKKSKSN